MQQPLSNTGTRLFRKMQYDPLLPIVYVIAFLCFVLVGAAIFQIDTTPTLLIYIDLVVGIFSLVIGVLIQKTTSKIPRRLFAGVVAVGSIAALTTDRGESTSTLIISTVPILIFILAEQSLWPILLEPLFLVITVLVTSSNQVTGAFVGFHLLIFLTMGGVSINARRSAERALEAERRADQESARAEQESERAENEGRIKRMFGSISHELNNATTGMAALLSLVIQHVQNDPFLNRSISALQWNISDVQRLSNQLRLLAKTGDIHLEMERFPVRQLIDNMVTEAESWVAQHSRSITITVHCNDAINICGNEFWLGLYLRTHIKNCLEAIDQSSGDGAIEIHVTQGDGITISISDSGPGFPADRLVQLNDPSSGTGIGTSKTSGTGIGIPFMKMVALLHNAQLVFSNKNGTGAVVELRLRG